MKGSVRKKRKSAWSYQNSGRKPMKPQWKSWLARDILYTVPEAAKLLRVNKNLVYDLIRCGYLRSINLGRRKASRKALLDFVEQFEGQTVELPGVRSE